MKQCFVIQGYGKKIDYTNGRELDLDASYEIIKTAVESAGLECVRADEIVHSGTIDVPMYERLLNADLVIADLSTYNVNAAFELGVRYALRPHTTIVLAEEQFKSPFDMSHIVIRRYKHLGEEVGYKEARRLMKELQEAIKQIIGNPVTDSPVYTYLPQLKPPQLSSQLFKSVAIPSAPKPSITLAGVSPSPVAQIVGEDNPSAKTMLDKAMERIKNDDFSSARLLLQEVNKMRPDDSFVVQQLALATYKSKQPSVLEALGAACEILKVLTPETSNNPETLGLWGAIHKRMWEECDRSECLEKSISAYERGFYIKQDHYNGINLAYLLNQRALHAMQDGNCEEALADFVQAKRVRKDVIRFASPLVDKLEDKHGRYWVIATLFEAAIGLGDKQAAAKWDAQAKAMDVPNWMQQTRETQAIKLKDLLTQYVELTNNNN
ncbi:TRAFs-binding domain-containing protein [Methylotuvimicrobium alcaliphilum]|uniref:Uncharacterized protein n=1 Tax=Methylotuvimicrobium alcaliphilum (strain DSM 19304 / NCIMB 14124 / VKM B-2133 / 20Z) TaxID=1091494 RepID=G4SUX7_META2|nr:TRAFs-binding domain-containing protein [Methylotuvimicrobium alcaliphilum]CCE24036.1 conserved protein of unknown function [Methylotuvimicrobium alcaliphilum 20Z]